MSGAPGPFRVLYKKFPKVGHPIPYGNSLEYWSYIWYSTPRYSLSHLGSLTSLAILSIAAPQASPSNGVNSGNYGFDS